MLINVILIKKQVNWKEKSTLNKEKMNLQTNKIKLCDKFLFWHFYCSVTFL